LLVVLVYGAETSDNKVSESKMPENKRDYAVGRGKPPVHTRFKKGQSGNPRGPRPKNLPALLVEALNDKVVVTIDGERREITKREAVATQLVNKSTGTDLHATRSSASPPGFNGNGRPRAQPGGQELADKLSRDCRRIIASDWYRQIFPTRLSPAPRPQPGRFALPRIAAWRPYPLARK
jgi:hypothetical protein